MLYMFFAPGFEETEAVASLDVIRRAGIDVRSVGVGSKHISGSHGISVNCDMDAEEATFTGLDGVILPGGMPGTLNLEKSERVNEAVDFCFSNGKLVAAICAAPSVLGKKGLLKGKSAVCYPGFEQYLEGADIPDKYVVTSGNVITARGMGSAVEFGLAIAAYFKGEAAAGELRDTLECFR
ncbi:MAG: DJ-1/PfpI family protein [Clostridia bacterium]|nr:DJ-1/PfpI family protein [Clostridia bacterium]